MNENYDAELDGQLQKRKNIGIYAIIIIAYAVSNLLVGIIGVLIFGQAILEDTFSLIVLQLIAVAIPAAVYVYIDRVLLKKNFIELKTQIRENIITVAIGVGLLYAVLFASSAIYEYFGITSGSDNEAEIQSLFTSSFFSNFLLFLLLVLVTPFVEEMLFRRAIYGWFDQKWGYIVAIIGSSLIFGLMHVLAYGDYIQSIPYILMGAVIGWSYYHSGKNIYVSFTVHMINNLVTFLLYIYLLS